MLSTRYIVCYLTQVVWQPLFCCAPLPSILEGKYPENKLEIENKLNGNSNLNHSMVKADVKQSRYIVSKCSIIASIIKVVTNSTKNHNCPDQKPELFNTNHQWPQILGFLRYKSLNTDRFANIEKYKKKNQKIKKDVPVARRWYTGSIRMDGESAERLSVTCSPVSTSRSTGSLRRRKTREIPQRWK